MRIPSIQSKQPPDRSRAPRRAPEGGAAFGQYLAEAGAADGAAAPASAGVSAMETPFSIHQVDSATDRRSRGLAIRRADTIIDQLAQIQADLLAGAIPPARLQALTKILRTQRESSDDSRLNDLIDAIELRAEVEIAKFGNGG
jgi:hypothetical protein